ncbi:BlaI/MecI/CopY family transcriptional regulator [Phosphitispora sp. TUW77]|uniref:BlaI/MecI/CopY family transcriptional regulator n=1 Tax=Phosphitispora sp. TUW77 TaxID=3152361 RepID=UPI003AB538FF
MFSENMLGPLEADIMLIIWKRQLVTVHDVYEELLENRSIAYNTVMTVMTRLARKGILHRQKKGRSYLYYPGVTKSEVARSMFQYVIDKIYGGSRVMVLSHLINDKTLRDYELDYLKAIVRKKNAK